MNKSYKVVYSKARGKLVAVSELTRACMGKLHSSKVASVSALVAALGAAVMAVPASAVEVVLDELLAEDEMSARAPSVVADHEATLDWDGSAYINLSQTGLLRLTGIGLIEDTYGLRSSNAELSLGTDSIAIGESASASGDYSIAYGHNAEASSAHSNAFGDQAKANKSSSNAFGYKAEALGDYSNSIGNEAKAGMNANALGLQAEASGQHSNAMGWKAQATSTNAIAIGAWAGAQGTESIALGRSAGASEASSMAIGYYAAAKAANAVALGTDSVADEADTISVGRAADATTGHTEANGTAITRRIVNVHAGTQATDAATVGQLQTVSKKAGEKYLVLTSTAAPTSGITNNEFSINASDVIASGTTALATVKAVYDEVRPVADGTYVKTAQTTAANLAALDKQVSTNSSLLGYLGVNATDNDLTTIPATSAKATGRHSLAVGEETIASSRKSVAIGSKANATGVYSLAVGADVEASGISSSAFGAEANASGNGSNALGSGANASGVFSNAIGSAVASGLTSIAFGNGAEASDTYSIAVGTTAVASSYSSIAFGRDAEASASNSIAFGDSVVASGVNSIAFGNIAKATGHSSNAIGFFAQATAQNATALGTNAVADEADTVSVGRTAKLGVTAITRRIVNVAAGTKATDAATVGQLQTLSKKAGEQYLVLTSTTAPTSSITNNELSIKASDTVASDTTALATVKAVYDEVRPVAGSGETLSYVSADKTTAANLKALDKQVGINAAGIQTNADAITNLKNATNTTISALGSTYAKLDGTNLSEEGSAFNAGKWAEALSTDAVIAGSGTGSNLLVTGKAVYDEVRPVAGSGETLSYVSADKTTAANLKALDKQAGTNAADIQTNADAITELENATNTTISGLGSTYAKLDGTNLSEEGSAFDAGKWAEALSKDAVIAGTGAGSNLLVTGTALYDEVRPVAESGETLTYVGADKTTAANLKALDTQVKINADDIDDLKNLSNISDMGKSNVRTLAKEAVQVASGTYTEVESSNSTDGKTKIYKVNVKAEGAVADGDNGIVKGGTVYTAIQNLKSATDTAIDGLGDVYAKLDGTNLDTTSFNAGNWATALGGGVIGGATVTNSNLLVTGATVFAEVRPERDGNYVKNEWTAGKNFIELDSLIKGLSDKVAENDGKISAVDEKAEAAKTAAAAAQGKADLAYGKAEEAKAEALKHSSVVSSNGHLTVTQGTNADGGVQYDLAISETADFTAKQTTWKDGDAFSTANSSGFFSGGASAENADAYMSKGVVSAGTDAEKKIVLDGNTGKATFGKTVTIDGTSGKISGLAAGEVSETSTDAVNGSQLYEVQQGVAQNAEGIESLGRAVSKVDRKIDRTGALAAALAGLHPQDYDEDHPVSGAVGIGHYKGKQALAVGMFVRPVENFMVSLGASGSADDYMLNAGASFRFGGPTLKKSPQQMMAKLSDQEVTIRDLSAQNLAQKTRLESQDEKLAQQASEIEKLKALVADIQKQLAK